MTAIVVMSVRSSDDEGLYIKPSRHTSKNKRMINLHSEYALRMHVMKMT